jgi:hypothetical protein
MWNQAAASTILLALSPRSSLLCVQMPRALAQLDLISSGQYSGSSVVCSARAHHRLQLNAISTHVKLAPSTCIIKEGSGSDLFVGKDCHLLQGLQDALLECAPPLARVLVDAVAHTVAQLFTDEVLKGSTCIKQEHASSGVFLRISSLNASSAPATACGLSAFADSLGCVASAVCAAMPCPHADAESSLSNSAVSAIVQRACHKLCVFAANCAGDFSQAQMWSAGLQQLPPQAAVDCSPVAAFWELWADKQSVDAVNATQQQLLQMNAGTSLRQCRNAAECATAVWQTSCCPSPAA